MREARDSKEKGRSSFGEEVEEMVGAYVLIRVVPGLEPSALSQIRVIPGVKEVILVFGRWDAIVQAEANSLHSLSRLVISQIRGIQGVQATETLIAAEV